MSTYEIFISVLLFFEALAAVVGLLHWSSSKNMVWKYFAIYLLLSFLGEVAGFTFTKFNLTSANHLFFEFFIIPAGYFFLYWMYAKSLKQKHLPILFSILYFIAWLIDIFVMHRGDSSFFVISYSCGLLFLLILIFRFLFNLIKSDEILTLKKNQLFWVSIGLLVFGLGSFPYYALQNFFEDSDPSLPYKYWRISIILNYVQYLLFTFSFLCNKIAPTSKSSM